MTGEWEGDFRVTARVLNHSRATGAALLVAVVIAHLSDRRDEGWASVGVRELMAWTGLNARKVTEAIKDLEARGELEVQRGRRLSGPRDARQYRYRIKAEYLRTLPSMQARGRRAMLPPNVPTAATFNVPTAATLERVVTARMATSTYPQRERSEPEIATSTYPLSNDARAYTETRVSENRDNASANAETHRAVALADVDIDRTVTHLFAMPEATDGVAADETPAAGDEGRRATLIAQAGHELREIERLAGEPRPVRETLHSLGWNEASDGKVSAWLRRQPNEKLIQIIVAARADQRRVEALS